MGLFFWAFFWGPFFTHTPLISLSSLLLVCVGVVRVSILLAPEREKKKRPRDRSGLVDDTVRRSLSSSFLALGSSAWSLEISSKFFAFPISIRKGII